MKYTIRMPLVQPIDTIVSADVSYESGVVSCIIIYLFLMTEGPVSGVFEVFGLRWFRNSCATYYWRGDERKRRIMVFIGFLVGLVVEITRLAGAGPTPSGGLLR
jgi:hypothetical protein